MIRRDICGIHMHVEKECTRCHKMFRASSDSQDVCPVCLNDEFSAGVTLSDGSDEAVAKLQTSAMQRQSARANRLGKRLRVNNPFSVNGGVRCALAVFLFSICVFLFLLSDGSEPTFLNQLEYHYQLCISLGTAIVSALLILPSFSGHKTQVGAVVAVILLLGGAMPSMWHYRVDDAELVSVPLENPQTPEVQVRQEGRLLDERDLVLFRNAKKGYPHRVHYAIFLRYSIMPGSAEGGNIKYVPLSYETITLVRKSLSRLLHGAKVESLKSDSGYGVIFTITNAPGEKQNITTMLSRYGEVYFSDPEEGIYEVAYNERKVLRGISGKMDERRNPRHPAYVELNMEALRSLDAEVVRAAAVDLATSDVKRLRNDILNCLIETLQEPWASAPDTYKALVEALVVYAPQGTPRVADILLKYFEISSKNQRPVSKSVVLRLAKEAPDKMHGPVLKLWQYSPSEWNEVAGVLIAQLEPYMIEQLLRQDIRINEMLDVLRYLEPYGTQKSIPVLRQVSETAVDQTIRHKAAGVISAINSRIAEEQK